jgi:CO/xanthine dehydrogenase Mo-binding subunit
VIAGHAALLALKSGRPVKIIYDRTEDMVATTKRHPSVVRHRTGVTRGGRIVAMDIDVMLDGGAYVTLSPVVLSRERSTPPALIGVTTRALSGEP